jgi:hypothetical protein
MELTAKEIFLKMFAMKERINQLKLAYLRGHSDVLQELQELEKEYNQFKTTRWAQVR